MGNLFTKSSQQPTEKPQDQDEPKPEVAEVAQQQQSEAAPATTDEVATSDASSPSAAQPQHDGEPEVVTKHLSTTVVQETSTSAPEPEVNQTKNDSEPAVGGSDSDATSQPEVVDKLSYEISQLEIKTVTTHDDESADKQEQVVTSSRTVEFKEERSSGSAEPPPVDDVTDVAFEQRLVENEAA